MEARRQLLCNTRGCKFMKHTDKKNNGGTHCCLKCQRDGRGHGGKCNKHKIEYMKCNRGNCHFMKNPDVFNNGGSHCCNNCKKNKPHGTACTRVRVGRPEVKEDEKVEVEILEEYHGIDYPHHNIKHFPCGSLREARAIAAREIGGNKHIFASFCKQRNKIWIKNNADKNHPKVKNGVMNQNITLFYLKALFELGLAKCNRQTCNFMKDPDQKHGFCCLMCKTGGFHGPLCKQVGMGAVIREERSELKCDRPGCKFTKHPNIKNNGGTHCCHHCKTKGRGHGKACEKIPVNKVIRHELKCDRPGCHFVKNPDPKNNGGNHCCNSCKKDGQHGRACTRKRVGAVMQETGVVVREERFELKCERRGCKFTKHPNMTNNGGTHCCHDCKFKGGGHGKQCKQISIDLKCVRPGCHFVKHPQRKNNGGTHCCQSCLKEDGQHGRACTRKLLGGVMQELATGFV